MKDLITGFGDQLRHALEIGANTSLKENTKKIESVLITGLGGSGIGGTIVSELTAEECSVPVATNKGYDLPGYINENTLIICSSFSGNTEETISAVEEAVAKGAHIIGVTSGGEMQEICTKNGFDCVVVPGGNPPRTALAFSLVQIANLTEQFYHL